jgi:diguanylate cyclase (GGDEF)-like protein/PAS domain S-box-containing protein
MAYFAIASLTIVSTSFDGGIAHIWVASALLTAFLVPRDVRHWWPAIVSCGIANGVATSLFGLGPASAAPMMMVSMAEPLIAAGLLRWFGRRADYLDSLGNVILFAGCAGLVAPLLTSLFAAAAVTDVTHIRFSLLYREWFAGHALGMIVFAPMVTLLLRGEVSEWLRNLSPMQRVETAALAIGMVAVSLLVFMQDRYPLLFVPILPLTIIAFRLGRVGAVLAIVLLVLTSSTLTAMGIGPINLIKADSAGHSLLLQFYLAVTVMTILPITAELKQRKDIFRRLRESEARYKLITESSTDIVLELDPDGVISYVSPSVIEITGFAPSMLIGHKPHELLSGPDAYTFMTAHRQVRESPGSTSTVEYRSKDAAGQLLWFEANTRGIFDDQGTLIGSVSAIRDISQRKSLEMQLAHAAATDPLTGLANRRAFDMLLDRKIADRREGKTGGCVAIFDIDYFKMVNDRHGHAVGDMVLKSFAAAALRIVRAQDYVGRLGGEEFGIILDGVDLDQAERICDRLRDAVSQIITLAPSGAQVGVTVSAGIAAISPDCCRHEIMMAADEALYAAKAAGRDRLAIAA